MIYWQVEEERKRRPEFTFTENLLCARYHVRLLILYHYTLCIFHNYAMQVLPSLFYRRNSYLEKLNHSPKHHIARKTADLRFELKTI